MAEPQKASGDDNPSAKVPHGRQLSTASTAPGDAVPTSSAEQLPADGGAESQAEIVSLDTDIPVASMNEVDTIPAGSRFSAGDETVAPREE